MFKHRFAALALATSLAALGTACGDRAPHVIQLQPPSPADVDRPGSMTVNGQATLEVSPDCADISITIAVEHDRTAQAVKQLEHKKLAMIAAMQKIGVEVAQLKLSSLHLDPVYAVDGRGFQTSHVRTYKAQITVTATTKDFAKIGDIMDAAATAGATNLATAFRRSDLDTLKKKVREMALAAAKEKAELTASTLGIELGRVVSVAETPNGMMWHAAYFPNAMATRDVSSAVALGGQLQPLTLDVTVGYEFARET